MACDVVVIGGGHNGLVAASMLARAGRGVVVLEASEVLGGACRTERPFARAPGLGCSTGAYLLGPMPPEVVEATGLRVKLIPRRPHGYFVDVAGRSVAFGVGARGLTHVGAADRAALELVDAALAMIRDDLAPLWLREACTLEESIAAVRDAPIAAGMGSGASAAGTLRARELYRALTREPIRAWIARFGFESELVAAVVSTDAFVGSDAGPDTPGAGLNFLAHNMLRLPAGDGRSDGPLGAWQLVEGGMGAVTAGLAASAHAAGAVVRTGARVVRVTSAPGGGVRVELFSGETLEARECVVSTDPHRAAAMLGPGFGVEARGRVGASHTPATSLKVNLALSRLPTVLGEGSDALGTSPLAGTVHVLPTSDCFRRMDRARRAALAGATPDADDMMIDVYTHTAVDPSLCDEAGRHSMSLFAQWAPPGLRPHDGERLAWALVRGPVSRVLPDLADCVEEVMVLTASAIEARFGITGGHIHHLDNRFAFERRLPARAALPGVYLASAACHPAGSVIGAAGYIAAGLILRA